MVIQLTFLVFKGLTRVCTSKIGCVLFSMFLRMLTRHATNPGLANFCIPSNHSPFGVSQTPSGGGGVDTWEPTKVGLKYQPTSTSVASQEKLYDPTRSSDRPPTLLWTAKFIRKLRCTSFVIKGLGVRFEILIQG